MSGGPRPAARRWGSRWAASGSRAPGSSSSRRPSSSSSRRGDREGAARAGRRAAAGRRPGARPRAASTSSRSTVRGRRGAGPGGAARGRGESARLPSAFVVAGWAGVGGGEERRLGRAGMALGRAALPRPGGARIGPRGLPGPGMRRGAGFVYEDSRSMCSRAELGLSLYRGTRSVPVWIGNSCFVKVCIAKGFSFCLGCCSCHPSGLQLKFTLIPFCLIAVS